MFSGLFASSRRYRGRLLRAECEEAAGRAAYERCNNGDSAKGTHQEVLGVHPTNVVLYVMCSRDLCPSLTFYDPSI